MSYGFDGTKRQEQKLLRYVYISYLVELTIFSVISLKFSLKSYQDHYIFRVPLSNYDDIENGNLFFLSARETNKVVRVMSYLWQR